MNLKTVFPQILVSSTLRNTGRLAHLAKRKVTGKPPTLHVFLEPGEPYSELLVQALPKLEARYGLATIRHRVGAPEKSAAPEPELLAEWSARDAEALARVHGLASVEGVSTPIEGDAEAGASLRRKLGHYSSGTIWFEGEWYWGIDRLVHLERRLGALPGDALFEPPAETEQQVGGAFEMFFSLRSPYSYIVLMRVFDMARRWGAEITLRPVLPMVMRSLPVPREKRFYIVRDCARESDRFGLEFGKICDPVGKGVENGLSILVDEIQAGRGEAFLDSYMRGVWAEGIDPATPQGLYTICKRAGVDWAHAQALTQTDGWRDVVEKNRQDLFAGGHWGVPSFRVGDRMCFGQDRLWQVGEWLAEEAGQPSSPGPREHAPG